MCDDLAERQERLRDLDRDDPGLDLGHRRQVRLLPVAERLHDDLEPVGLGQAGKHPRDLLWRELGDGGGDQHARSLPAEDYEAGVGATGFKYVPACAFGWGRAGLRLELEPPVAREQHLDPDVEVPGRDQVAAVFLLAAGSVPDPDACGQPQRPHHDRHRGRVLLTEAGPGLREELEQVISVVAASMSVL